MLFPDCVDIEPHFVSWDCRVGVVVTVCTEVMIDCETDVRPIDEPDRDGAGARDSAHVRRRAADPPRMLRRLGRLGVAPAGALRPRCRAAGRRPLLGATVARHGVLGHVA
jgi:hypothetical protein